MILCGPWGHRLQHFPNRPFHSHQCGPGYNIVADVQFGNLRNIRDGTNVAVGETVTGGTSRVWGTDLTLKWQPPHRAKYRGLTWRTELLLSERDDPAGRRRDAWGGYSYVEGLARRNLYLGLRLDRVEEPLDPSLRSWGIVPYLSWWQSEFVRLRAELQHLEHDANDDSEDRLLIQLTWAAGPHKHETY